MMPSRKSLAFAKATPLQGYVRERLLVDGGRIGLFFWSKWLANVGFGGKKHELLRNSEKVPLFSPSPLAKTRRGGVTLSWVVFSEKFSVAFHSGAAVGCLGVVRTFWTLCYSFTENPEGRPKASCRQQEKHVPKKHLDSSEIGISTVFGGKSFLSC